MTDPKEIARKLTKRAAKVLTETPHPQPLEGHWFWAGTTGEAIIAARAGFLDGAGFTPLGLAVREALLQDTPTSKASPHAG